MKKQTTIQIKALIQAEIQARTAGQTGKADMYARAARAVAGERPAPSDKPSRDLIASGH